MSNPSAYMELLCPNCDRNGHMKVIESRAVKQLNAIRRRRRCDHCGHRFTTYETLERDSTHRARNILADAAERLKRLAESLKQSACI